MKLETVLVAAFVTTVVGLGTWSWYYGSIFPIAPSLVASTPPPISTPSVLIKVNPPPVLSVYNASAKLDGDLPSIDDLKRKDEKLERCYMNGGVPVMGFGFRVVCLKPQSAEWWDDPKLPESKKP